MSNLIAPPSRSEIYADLDLRMIINPLSKDLVILKDIDAVRQSVLRLVLTNYYEIPFEPFKGANISALLFEQADEFTAYKIRQNILRVLREYEPRINEISVKVEDDSDKNAYSVSISFTIIAYEQNADIVFSLKRLR
jgi:phage baseplate assembly protein W